MANPLALFDYWSELQSDANATIHPKDKAFFDSASNSGHAFITEHRPPGPWDGPLMTAKVIICYANPKYDPNDKDRHDLIINQLSGREELPDCWDDWYLPRMRTIGLPIAKLRKLVSIFNVCPYSSDHMNDKEVRLAAGLPSVWEAQRHLREVLIPQALSGKLFLVVARKHQLWGVVEGNECETFRLIRNRQGSLAEVGPEIGAWLQERH